MRITRSRIIQSMTLLIGASFAGTASSATLADLGFSPEQIRAITAQANAPATSPGIAFGSPVGFGAGWGVIGFGIAGQTTTNAQDDVDGSATVSFGLGDPTKWVGLQTDVNLISLQNDFGGDGTVNFKLHTILPGRSAVSVGVERAVKWGDAEKDPDENVYAVMTKIFSLNPSNPTNTVPLAINIGVGDGRFESNDNDGVGLFGGITLIPHQQISIITDWSGQALNAALSFVPFRRVPVSLTLGALNVTERDVNENDNQEPSTEFSGTIAYSVRF